MQKDKDYTLEYLNNVNAGTAVIQISGRGNYTGTITKTFSIVKAMQWFTCSPRFRSYTKTRLTDTETFVITVNDVKGSVSYESSDSRYVTVSNGVAYIKGGIPAGVYEIYVTASGDENYKAASKTITISVR